MIVQALLEALGWAPVAAHAELDRLREAARGLDAVVASTNRTALDIIDRQQASDPHAAEPKEVRDMRALMAGVLDRRHRP